MVVYLKEGKWRNDIRRIRLKKDTEKIVQLQSLLNIVKFNGMFTILLSQWNISSLSLSSLIDLGLLFCGFVIVGDGGKVGV